MRFLIVDDHRLFRESLTLLLREHYDSATLIQAATVKEALAALALYPETDLVLLDLALPGIDGMAGIPLLLDDFPTVPIVVLSASADHRHVREALRLGAVGFVHKAAGAQELRCALDLVLSGEIYAPLDLLCVEDPPTDTSLAQHADPLTDERLTKRQQEVLNLLAQGLPNKSIANRLALSERTVKIHVSAILKILGARNRTDAVRIATARRARDGS